MRNNSRQKILASSLSCFNTIGTDYKLPAADHKFEVKTLARIGDGFGSKHAKVGYMDQVVKRAKSSVDPRKYALQSDWEKTSLNTKDSYQFPKAKRITLADE